MEKNMIPTYNQIPSLTWNWLHMNEAEHAGAHFTSSYKCFLEHSKEIISEYTSGFSLLDMKTGMGSVMNDFVSSLDIPVLTLTADSSDVPLGYENKANLSFHYTQEIAELSAVELIVPDHTQMTVIMNFTADEMAEKTAGILTKYHIGKNASLRFIQVEMLNDHVEFYNDIGGRVEENGSFELIQLVLGAKQSFLGCYTDLFGKSSKQKTRMAYYLSGNEMLDINEVVSHAGRKTNCDIAAYGVLRDESTKLFRGTIDFLEGAKGAVGNEIEDVLLMDDHVVNKTIPVILCAEEEVEGNHGASIGKIDEGLLFYLESRGISKDAVYEMMAKSKIDIVKHQIADEKIVAQINDFLQKKENDIK